MVLLANYPQTDKGSDSDMRVTKSCGLIVWANWYSPFWANWDSPVWANVAPLDTWTGLNFIACPINILYVGGILGPLLPTY